METCVLRRKEGGRINNMGVDMQKILKKPHKS